MSIDIHITTKVLPNGTIEITAPELRPGMTATIVITLENEKMTKRSALDILAEMPDHRLFQTSEEVDAYLHEEREAWDQ